MCKGMVIELLSRIKVLQVDSTSNSISLTKTCGVNPLLVSCFKHNSCVRSARPEVSRIGGCHHPYLDDTQRLCVGCHEHACIIN